MKIIHTSDWHLGKTLEGNSRLDEQKKFIDEFVDIVNEKEADLVIIAGDVYDTANPPARAENLFCDAIKRISKNGNRAVLIIAGNHDSPERLEAIRPLTREQGIIILGMPKSTIEKGRCGKFMIVDSGEGYIELKINGENAVIITIPYPSEKRLGEIISEESDEKKIQKSYSCKIGEIFNKLSQKYREDTINIMTSHIYISGGEISDSERSIQLGGSYAVAIDSLPSKAQYIALGHLHKTQKFNIGDTPIIYSGSPIQYSKKERNNKASVYFLNIKASEAAKPERIYLSNYKPIEVWHCDSIEEAIDKCKNDGNRDIWVYLDVDCDRIITQQEIKEMKEYRKDIIEIRPNLMGETDNDIVYENLTERNIEDVFRKFYLWRNKVEPTQEIVELFLSIAGEGEE
ncbi:exonuclease SbcCD subunit D [Clostridium sp. JN-1]|uniref:exonuclease SbcCD subunit D n=1 Tax=Clostridium sp. JN-1 TaxID=2483110 RepID=UPI000F0B0C8D|nr:exonuclease SbcCD subunit D [Clostridium sp. JN-1]